MLPRVGNHCLGLLIWGSNMFSNKLVTKTVHGIQEVVRWKTWNGLQNVCSGSKTIKINKYSLKLELLLCFILGKVNMHNDLYTELNLLTDSEWQGIFRRNRFLNFSTIQSLCVIRTNRQQESMDSFLRVLIIC